MVYEAVRQVQLVVYFINYNQGYLVGNTADRQAQQESSIADHHCVPVSDNI